MYLILIVFFMVAIVIHDKNTEIKYLKKKISELEEKLKSLGVSVKQNQPNQVTKAVQEVPISISPLKVSEKVCKSEEINQNNSYSTNKETSQGTIINNTVSNNANVHKLDDAERVRKIEKKKNENRNNAILTVGAVFIVVAALSFLYSTWHTVPNIVKSAVVLILAGVFLGLSRLAGKVFKLTKTAKTFFYIAMVYIPLCLFSISLFGLAGEYFSINGEGRYIYLSLASFFIMSIYLFFAYKNKDKKLYFSGNLMQFVAMIFLSLIFVTKLKEVLGILLMYSVILNLCNLKFEKRFVKESKFYGEALSGIFGGIAILIGLVENNGLIIESILVLGALLNLLIIYKQNRSAELYGGLYAITILLVTKVINLEILSIPFMVKQIAIIAYVVASSYYHNFTEKDKYLKQIINGINLAVMTILYIITRITDEKCIDVLVLVTISMFLSTIEYIKSKREDKGIYTVALIINSLLLLLPESITSNEISLMNYLICTFISICMIIILHKDKEEMLKLIPLMLFLINLYRYDVLIGSFNLTYILNIIAILVFGFLSIKDKKDISYRVSSIFYLIGMCAYAKMSIYVSILLITIWSLIQMLFTEAEIKKVMKNLIIASLSFMYMVMLFQGRGEVTLTSYTITIIESLLCWFIFSRSKYLKALPIIGMMIPLYSYDLILLERYDITLLLNIALVAVFTYYSITSKEDKVYKIASFLYLLNFVIKYYEINIYIKFALFIIWGVIQYIYSEGVLKDLMKALIATCTLGVYISMLNDLELLEVVALQLIGYFIYLHVITREIIKNYMKDYKILEYIACAIVYLGAFDFYKDGIDLAIAIVAQAVILMVSYSKKLGPAFAVTLVAIIINVFYLTQNFWLSIPWWGYLVSVGGVLIVFAARNELSEKKDIKTVKEKLEKVKNYLDM